MERPHPFHRLLPAVGDVETETQRHIAAQRQIPAGGHGGIVILGNHLRGVLFAGERHHRLDAVFGHIVERAAAGDGLPDFHRAMHRARHHRNFLEVVASIRHRRRDGVVLALMAPAFLIKSLADDFHLLQVKLPVGVVVNDGRAESFHFAGMVAAPDAENHPPAGEDVGHGEILGDAEGMPHWDDVERLAEFEVLGQAGQMHAHQDEVGDALVALVLEMMLGHPHTVKAARVHMLGQRSGVAVRLDELFVAVTALVGGGAVGAHIVQVNLPYVEDGETLDH